MVDGGISKGPSVSGVGLKETLDFFGEKERHTVWRISTSVTLNLSPPFLVEQQKLLPEL